MSIPRLELTPAVLAVRLNDTEVKEIDFGFTCESHFWTDSTAVLHCIHNKDKRFPSFVANRLAIIEKDSDESLWHYVPSKFNPADITSRGIPAEDSAKLRAWLSGPEFLLDWTARTHWEEPTTLKNVPPKFLPVRKQENFSCLKVKNEIAFDRFSTLYKLKRVIALVLRYKTILLSLIRKQTAAFTKNVSVEKLQCAETAIIVCLQRQHFPMLFEFRDDEVSTKSLPRYLQKLCPNIIDGVAHVGGRLSRALVDFNMKHPIILPQHSHFTELLIPQHHKEIGHSGASHTWAALCCRYWIIKGGNEVRKCIGKCILCRKRKTSVSKQLMAYLPTCRLQFDQPPFSSTGMDYFGPILVKQRRSTVKRYGCVFTCLTMRGVHIEIANSLDTDLFINALRRFIARRGRPKEIFSDNGTNFVGANRVFRDALQTFNQDRIHSHCSQQNIEWNFNPPTASHFGGAWERMIRSICRILGGLFGNQTLNQGVEPNLNPNLNPNEPFHFGEPEPNLNHQNFTSVNLNQT